MKALLMVALLSGAAGFAGSIGHEPGDYGEAVPLTEQAGLQLRNLQFQQSKLLVEQFQLQLRYQELQREVEKYQAQIVGTCESAAKAQKVPLDKYTCDAESLSFQRKPTPKEEPKK